MVKIFIRLIIIEIRRFSECLTTRGITPHIEILKGILKGNACAFEMTDSSGNLAIGHVAPGIVLPVDGSNSGMGLSFLLPSLVQHEEITHIGGEQHAQLGSRIAQMRFVLGASHRHAPRRYHFMAFMLQQTDELIGIHIIIEIDFRDLSRDRESSEQFVWYGETEMQLRRWAIRLSIEANRHQDEGI
jgi:hypothetical protein